MQSRVARFLLLVVVNVVVVMLAHGQGVIVPGPCERCPAPSRPVTLPRALPIKSIKIDTKILSQVATTHVEQSFAMILTRRSRVPISFRSPKQLRFQNLPSGTAIAVS